MRRLVACFPMWLGPPGRKTGMEWSPCLGSSPHVTYCVCRSCFEFCFLNFQKCRYLCALPPPPPPPPQLPIRMAFFGVWDSRVYEQSSSNAVPGDPGGPQSGCRALREGEIRLVGRAPGSSKPHLIQSVALFFALWIKVCPTFHLVGKDSSAEHKIFSVSEPGNPGMGPGQPLTSNKGFCMSLQFSARWCSHLWDEGFRWGGVWKSLTALTFQDILFGTPFRWWRKGKECCDSQPLPAAHTWKTRGPFSKYPVWKFGLTCELFSDRSVWLR